MRAIWCLSLAAAVPGTITAEAIFAPEPALAQRAEAQTLSYGRDPLQTLDYWPGRSARAPLVVFVHGGGWKRGDKRMMHGSEKLRHWRELGYAVASLNYRLVPEATVERQAQDVAAAVALFKARFGPGRIALVGHSAGAHLVALVGTDPAYLRAAGLSFADIAGIVPLDGAAYDVVAQLENGPRIMQQTYRQAFGANPARQANLSPTRQAGAPNAAEFLILHVDRADGARQSAALAEALRRAGHGGRSTRLCRQGPARPHGDQPAAWRSNLSCHRRSRRLPGAGTRLEPNRPRAFEPVGAAERCGIIGVRQRRNGAPAFGT